MENLYLRLLHSWPYSERLLFCVCLTLVHSLTFWGFNLLMYIAHQKNWFLKYKIQPNKWPPYDLVKRTIITLAFHHIVTSPLLFYYLYGLWKYFGLRFEAPLPNIAEILLHFAFFILVNDTLFYWSHRLLHTPLLYQRIHKRHHDYKVSIGIAAEYAHPIETLISNSIPTLLGTVIIGPHFVTLLLWLFFRLWETVDAHSGYDLPIAPLKWLPFTGGAERHDFHHSKNIGNFGAFFTFWDHVMGTDVTFLEWKKKQNNGK
eukprot:TRINITY_DN483_c0_g1_i1.p1 TRINITY_DN483_c0_g1~~TRINITY_DN483_c0_g1_i1.p1  ORF type:complete len:260 (-),score=17.56 TRINITY_DN483_c0_g1_i1:72-851(-)